MLWLKAFHIIFMVTWFAGLFYLPRLFVYHCEQMDPAAHERFCTMERKLFAIMSLGGAGTVTLGLLLLVAVPPLMKMGWMHSKLALVTGLIAYHLWLWVCVRGFARQANQHSARFYRITNEIPALFLIAIVLLVVVKPA
jgi:putative membrane protein